MSATLFGVLGTVVVRQGDQSVEIPATKQRIVLAKLLVHANEPVRVDALADAIWPGQPLAGAPVTVRNYVRRLRQVLGPAGGRILTRPPGYTVEVEDGELDALLFARLTEQGSAAAHRGEWWLARQRLGAALTLWRGTPFADVPSPALPSQEVPRLELIRTCALEWRVEADLHLGLHAELVPELQRLVAEHPMSERFHAQLILALYRSGRRGDALGAFQRARQLLLEELGLEPGEELQELQRRILTADPGLAFSETEGAPPGPALRQPVTAPEVPRQLPHRLPRFIGRGSVLRDLREMTGAPDASGTLNPIVAIDGTAGVGKTTLAVHFAHEIASHYPDGQLYLNLRGFDDVGSPMDPADAIRHCLEALQIPPRRIPAALDSQAALYRSLLSDRRLLILLDNARDADHVRPLLPGTPGTLVIVTSRTELTGLAAGEGAHLVRLDVLSQDEACLLLEARLGPQRVAAEPAAAAALIELCARLPIALSIAAGMAAGRPHLSVAAQVERLRSARERLDALGTGEAATDTRAVLSWSYRSLSSAAKRMFRLLGIHPGPDISAPAAASLAGLPASEASRLLSDLTRRHLLSEPSPGRFALHDLLRAYAAEQARAEDAEGRAARTRMLDHYLHTAHRADGLSRPARVPLVLEPPGPGVVPEEPADNAGALAWFAAEYSVLLGAVALTERDDPDARSWQLPWAIAGYLDLTGRWTEWAATQRSALSAACELDDRLAQAHARRSLGCALQALEHYDEAHWQLRQAQHLYRDSGDIAAQGRTCVNTAHVLYRQKRHDEAVTWARRGLDCARRSGDVPGEANALNAVGMCQLELKQYQEALAACESAMRIFQEIGQRRWEASTWDAIGTIRLQLGDYPGAADNCASAADIYLEFGDSYRRAESLGHAGDAYLAAGQRPEAVHAWREALAILDDLENPQAADVRAKIEAAEHAAVAGH